MEVKIFTKKDCPKCPPAKDLGEILLSRGYNVFFFDIGTIDGLAEAQFYGVMATPTILILKDNQEIKSWRGETPTIDEIEKYLK